jgi:hypothetical protein
VASRPGHSDQYDPRIKALEHENCEMCQANAILRKASACFALADFDRRSK